MSPDGTKLSEKAGKAASGEVPGSGWISGFGTMIGALYWVCQPGLMVMVAGLQNIEPRPPEPDAAPAKDRPCACALCSRTAKPPAIAPDPSAVSAARETEAAATERCKSFMSKPALETRCCSCVRRSGIPAH